MKMQTAKRAFETYSEADETRRDDEDSMLAQHVYEITTSAVD